MPHYLVYILDSDGHYADFVPLDCADDTEAAKQAKKQLVDGHDVELWQRDRKVAEFESKPRDDRTIE